MKKLIFDFDGTLVDSMREWSGKMLYVLEKNGVDYPSDIIKTITPLGDRGSAEYFISHFGVGKTPEELIAEMDEFAIKEYTYNIPAKATVDATLRLLKSRGFSLNILTASPHRMLDVCLKRVGIYDLFDNVWSCDDFGTTKSDVGIYHSVAQRLGTTAEDCVFFDDNIGALRVASESGMTVVGVYDDSSADYESDIRSISSVYVYTLDEIVKTVCEMSDSSK